MKYKNETRIHAPKNHKSIQAFQIKYSKAVDLVRSLPEKITRVHAVVPGNFIFGDFIEAFIVERNILVEKMYISTLSLSQENVDSLENLMSGDYVRELNLIVSSYFYSHERSKLIRYLYEKLDVDDKFQLAVCGNHTKIALIQTDKNEFFAIEGSANLRSSDCLESFFLEENKELYNFHQEWLDSVVQSFQTINKDLRGKRLWQVMQEKKERNQKQEQKQKHQRETLKEKNKSWEV